MEAYVREKLGLKVLKSVRSASGCVNAGTVYDTDVGKLFVKVHAGSEAGTMFRGEYESLNTLAGTKAIKVPEPLLVGEVDRRHFIVMEYLDMTSLDSYSSALGTALARLHLHNVELLAKEKRLDGFVGGGGDAGDAADRARDRFGFHVPTSCGYLPQNNDWSEDWVAFYARQKLEHQINMIVSEKGNREISQLWSQLQLKIPNFFKGVTVEPSLLHGDLWCGNAGETESGPVVFDPASFYGHHEYDLAIAVMFGGFGKKFFESYHRVIEKAEGFDRRQQLYLLFHHLNHWNHFGSHQRSSLQIMRDLVNG